jgi:hypothetical protein
MHWRGEACWRPPPCAGGGAGVGRLRGFQQIPPAPDLVVRLRGTRGMEGGIAPDKVPFADLLISGAVYRPSIWSRHSGAAGQLRRRGPKPSAAYALRRSTSGRPAYALRRGRAGGKTSMARPWSHTCGHAGDHGVRTANMECTRLWAAGGQACATAARRGGKGGGREARDERGEGEGRCV